MTKVNIISGFLGAGKTTLIKKLLEEVYTNEKIMLIENEFGQISVDQSFLKNSGVEITEMNSGCICCSLVGDFETSLKQVLEQYHPDRIIIEPSGVGKLSDVIQAVKNIHSVDIELESFITVIDAKKCKLYTKNFGEFFNNQIEYASIIILSRTTDLDEHKLHECVDIIRQFNQKAPIITTSWQDITGKQIVESKHHEKLEETLLHELNHEHHHKHEHECGCEKHHHHHHKPHECECKQHELHHHEHVHQCECEKPQHHHDCGCHHHEHHHHHANEVFNSWSIETAKQFTKQQLEEILDTLTHNECYGKIIRAKGIVAGNPWLEFDVSLDEVEIRQGNVDITGKICVIGQNLDENKIKELFGV